MFSQLCRRFVSTLLILILLSGLISLGCWQLKRAEMKTHLQAQYQTRRAHTITADMLDRFPQQDWRFYSLHMTGVFDNTHVILLDNKIVNHQVGYELYVPLLGNQKIMLVDRGFIPLGTSRAILPVVEPVVGKQKLKGMLDVFPAGGLSLGKEEKFNQQWPNRVTHIDLQLLKQCLHTDFYPYVLVLHPADNLNSSMNPQRHKGYALQWFMLAGVLLVGYLILIFRYNKKS